MPSTFVIVRDQQQCPRGNEKRQFSSQSAFDDNTPHAPFPMIFCNYCTKSSLGESKTTTCILINDVAMSRMQCHFEDLRGKH